MEWLMLCRTTSSGILLSGFSGWGDQLLLSALALSFGFSVITLCGFTKRLRFYSNDLRKLNQSVPNHGGTKATFAGAALPSLTELSKLLDETER